MIPGKQDSVLVPAFFFFRLTSEKDCSDTFSLSEFPSLWKDGVGVLKRKLPLLCLARVYPADGIA